MSSESNFMKKVIGAALIFFVLAIMALVVIDRARQSRAELPVLGTLPPFAFTAHDGNSFGLENMRGKINVVDFMFTRCKGPCPIMVTKMGRLYEWYKGTEKVQFISITVDPEHDTLPILQEYAERHKVRDKRWIFLWAPIDAVVRLSEGGFMLAADDLPGNHSTKFVLVDDKGQIRKYYSGLDDPSINILRDDIRQLLRDLP